MVPELIPLAWQWFGALALVVVLGLAIPTLMVAMVHIVQEILNV